MKHRIMLIPIIIMLLTSFLVVCSVDIEALKTIEETVVLAPEEIVTYRINVTYNASYLNGLYYFYEILDWGIDGHETQFNIENGTVENEYLNDCGSHFNEQSVSGQIEVYDGDAYNFIWGNDNMVGGKNLTLHYKIEYLCHLVIPGVPYDDDTSPGDDTVDNDTSPGYETEEYDNQCGEFLIAVIVAIFLMFGTTVLIGSNYSKKRKN